MTEGRGGRGKKVKRHDDEDLRCMHALTSRHFFQGDGGL